MVQRGRRNKRCPLHTTCMEITSYTDVQASSQGLECTQLVQFIND